MSNKPDISPKQIKRLERLLVLHGISVSLLYAASLIMLWGTVVEFQTENPKSAIVFGIIGWCDCFLADKRYQQYRLQRWALDEYKKQHNIK